MKTFGLESVKGRDKAENLEALDRAKYIYRKWGV
jgi:hypothetical protein